MIYKRDQNWHMDVTINGLRYREALKTTDGREAKRLEKKRVAEIQEGKGASKSGREFARKPFAAAADQFLEDRKPLVSQRTAQLEKERLKPLREFIGEKPLLRIRAEDIAAYQRQRRESVSGRTINMEVGVLRQMMKRAKVWNIVAEDVKMDRENVRPIAKVLTVEEKSLLFKTAASKEEWLVVHCAAVLAVSTTCRSVELKNLRWQDADFFEKVLNVRRSKTEAGHRAIPLNADAMAALARLLDRSESLGVTGPDHYVFPACERDQIDPSRPQKSWRTAWRRLVRETARRAGRTAGEESLAESHKLGPAKMAWRAAAARFSGLRFHDLRHQAITEMAETGASDATLMAMAGHLSRRMMEHYSHVRLAVKRDVVKKLESGLMTTAPTSQRASKAVN